MKAFSFIRSSLTGGGQQAVSCKPEESAAPGVPKVPSLLFDLELEDGGSNLADIPEDAGAAVVAGHVRALTELRSEEERQLASHMQLVQRLLADGHHPSLDVYEVADGLRKLGHAVTIRTALGGGGGNECLRNLRHSFLSCRMQGVHGQALYIVDPCFKEQFEIPHVNARYARIMADVPVSFIGTEEQIIAIVELMSKEISHAFQQAGATLPPWRQTVSMLSKWQPRKSEDLSLDAEVVDSRAPSLPIDLAPAHLRQLLAKGGNAPHLQRHSCVDPWLRPGGAHARVSLDEPPHKGGTSSPCISQKRGSVSSNVAPLIAQTAGMVASVQQSMSALGIRKSQGIPPLHASSHAVHLV